MDNVNVKLLVNHYDREFKVQSMLSHNLSLLYDSLNNFHIFILIFFFIQRLILFLDIDFPPATKVKSIKDKLLESETFKGFILTIFLSIQISTTLEDIIIYLNCFYH